ncbi:hypothetical protein M431DRAFT_451890 [Trichoderma harzianum CBS 226.95]|uniref:Uncharacterized protein n=1 Tax=Trichoderma harzianum CBS 226.95 TaxID=983964 RepID=A0A2T4AAS3_TRIHA|nr:hypothetical protein M431DRAFT_451890 [Trichoderma harzianum CBS 226.95]PTB54177.1 hypothetical protein M431DRAFT_451890 [Trichoderma harzianum CBS 226.95]
MLEDTVSGAWAWMKPAMGMGWCQSRLPHFCFSLSCLLRLASPLEEESEGKERMHSGSAGHKAERDGRRTEGSRTRSGLTWGRSRWAHERTKRKGRVFVRFCVGETAGRSEWEKGNRICLAGLLGGRKRLRLLVGRGARGARRC